MKTIGSLFSLSRQFYEDAHVETREAESDPVIIIEPIETDADDSRPRIIREDSDGESPVLADHVCQTCSAPGPLKLESLVEQRAHFRSDWHRYNLKRKLAGHTPVTEAAFDALIEEHDDVMSISGSDSSSDDGQSEADRRTRNQGSHTVFQSQGTRFGVWRALLGPDARIASPAALKERLLQLRDDAGLWAVILNRGGHFAAAIFACGPSLPTPDARAPPGSAATLFHPITHKTFHRYTVRAKAGGKQSSKDATGKYAKSAGSQIRRYNEAALRNDILETLRSWKLHLPRVTRIFTSAPGSNEAVLFEPDASPLERGDPRVVKIPFVTRRPTLSEARRVITALLAISQAEAAPQQPPQKEAQTKHSKVPQKAAQGARKEEEEAAPVPAPPQEPPLHQAARHGDESLVTRLLQEGHDPTVSVGKTAYAVASSKGVRDAFRRYMATAPQQWDWAAADVPSALTPEMDQHQQAKEAEKKARLKEKERERKKRVTERKKKEQEGAAAAAEAEISAAAAQAAAEASGGKEVVNKKVQYTQEQARLKREQMAAAAEARMAALKLASQQQTLW